MQYRINEIFCSLQGEGFNQGKQVVFIRLSGCNLKCWWCDTQHEDGVMMHIDEIISTIAQYNCQSVIITGGEPASFDLTQLLLALKTENYWIGIESNGTIDLSRWNHLLDYIAISPKGRLNNCKASEVRVVNEQLKSSDLLTLEQQIEAQYYFISPLEVKGEMNIKESLKLLGELKELSSKSWQLSLQMHKLAGIQ